MQIAPSQQSLTSVLPGTAILVADDDPDVCALMVAVLGDEWPIVEARDGREALQQAELHLPALIVCDSEMPVLRGREVIRTLASNPLLAKIPTILTSGYSKTEVLGECQPTAFLQKPFTVAELTRLVGEVLRTSA